MLDVENFKKWMDNHRKDHALEKPKSDLVGTYVESKINLEKIKNNIMVEEGDIDEVAEEFYENGGHISLVDDKLFTIDVNGGGSFSISRYFVKRA